MERWFRFFRIVNLPTVPGDVLVGAAVGVACGRSLLLQGILGAVLASVFLYFFGLADNDLVGAATDGPERPIPAGEISLRAARLARAVCLLCAVGSGLGFCLPVIWWCSVAALLISIVTYNRTKSSILMGLCRGLNVLCGTAVVAASFGSFDLPVLLPVIFWTAYVGWLTHLSIGEESDPSRKRRIGMLIGALIYWQLLVLLFCAWTEPSTRHLLCAGAVLLVALRLIRRLLPTISAS